MSSIKKRGIIVANRHIMVLDAGASAIRCHVFDESGCISITETEPWVYRIIDDVSPFAREFDAKGTWNNISGLIQRALRESGVSPSEVVAVTATSQRQAVVFLDSNGHEIYAGPNLDLRAVFEGAAIDEEMGSKVYTTTGHTPSFLYAPAKLRWYRDNRPNVFNSISTILTLADWLVFRLSGEMANEITLAGDSGLLNIADRQWATELLSGLGSVGISRLPLVQAGSDLGVVSAEASYDTGLSRDTVVGISGADTQCGLLGLGVHDDNEVGVVAGWSVTLQVVVGQPVLSPDHRTWAGCFLTPNKWVVESSTGDAGNSYRWLAETFSNGDSSSFENINAQASEVPIGSQGVMAFLGPSCMDMTNLGLRPGGIIFPVPLTFSDIGRGHLARAAIEAICYAVRSNLEQAEMVMGQTLRDVSVGGGMTRSQVWVDILKDVLGYPVRVSGTPEVTAIGAYLCGLSAIGEFADLDEAAESVKTSMVLIEPDPQTAAEYDDHYQRWLSLDVEMRRLSI